MLQIYLLYLTTGRKWNKDYMKTFFAVGPVRSLNREGRRLLLLQSSCMNRDQPACGA